MRAIDKAKRIFETELLYYIDASDIQKHTYKLHVIVEHAIFYKYVKIKIIIFY